MENPEDRRRTLTKDELNLAEFPFALPCLRAPRNCSLIRTQETGFDTEGHPIQREWTVHPSHLGLPLALDEEVFLGLIHLLHQQTNFKDRHVHFTQHHLFSILGWGGGRWAYTRLEESLIRLRGSTINCRDSFWDHKGKCYVSRGFSLIDNFTLYRRDDISAEKPFLSSVTFNDVIFESFAVGFIKTLDLDLYLSLRLPISRKLFRLLDKKLYKAPSYEIELMRLASRVALTDRTYPSDVKKHFAGAHEELQQAGFLRSASYIRRGSTSSIRYVMKPRESWKHRTRKITASPGENPLIQELVTRGITSIVARSLLKDHGEKRVADKLEVFDYLISNRSPAVTKNPAGFLRTSIEKDFSPPAGYISRAERQHRKEKEATARQLKRERADAAEKAHQEQKSQIDAIWSSLSDADKAHIESEALNAMNDFALKLYKQEKAEGRTSSGHHVHRVEVERLLVQRYLAQIPSATATDVPTTQ
ncbi:MAG: replication initiator protein A [Thermodesulfobacteriota bacterium]